MNTRTKTRHCPEIESLEDRRLLSEAGSLDPTFGTGGIVPTSFTKKDIEWADLRGSSSPTAGSSPSAQRPGPLQHQWLPRLVVWLGGKDHCRERQTRAALYPAGTANAGKIVTLAAFAVRNKSDFSLTRYNTNGSVDTSFGSKGVVVTDFGGGSDSATPWRCKPTAKSSRRVTTPTRSSWSATTPTAAWTRPSAPAARR